MKAALFGIVALGIVYLALRMAWVEVQRDDGWEGEEEDGEG